MSKFHIPGYYWYLPGEEHNRNFNHPREQNLLLATCRDVLLNNGIRTLGFTEFSREVLRQANLDGPREQTYIPVIIWFYNRQLLFQITSVPKTTNRSFVSVSLPRYPKTELQMDILKLNQYFREVNYNIGYIVVIMDIYSRYVWAAPVAALTVEKVTAAILSAFSRPGVSKNFFEAIREDIKKITVDGGSEFKGDFPRSLKQLFPQSEISISPPKHQTFNRPTLTGPIESAIRELRKLIRDYGLRTNSNILSNHDQEFEQHTGLRGQHGLTLIIFEYNTMPRAVLRNKTPNEVAIGIITNQPVRVRNEDLNIYMAHQRAKQIDKKRKFQNEQFPIITTRQQGYGYRLYLPQGAFPKEVDIRMSVDLYYIREYSNENVTLVDWEDDTKTKTTTWQSLVLVKAPVFNVFPHILTFVREEEERNTYQRAPNNLMQPYAVSEEIRGVMQAHNNERILDVPTGNQPTRVSSRSNKGLQPARLRF